MKYKIKVLLKEVDILSKFNCENIIKYNYSRKINNKFYILMEYFQGQTLRDFINKSSQKNELIEEQI